MERKRRLCRVGYGKDSRYKGGYYFAVMGDIPTYTEFLGISINGGSLFSIHGGTRTWFFSFGIRKCIFDFESVLAYFPVSFRRRTSR